MLRTFPVVVLVALGLVIGCAVDILRTELNIRSAAASEAKREAREVARDIELREHCAKHHTGVILFYKGVNCDE